MLVLVLVLLRLMVHYRTAHDAWLLLRLVDIGNAVIWESGRILTVECVVADICDDAVPVPSRQDEIANGLVNVSCRKMQSKC
jgi:hypothetical protein